MYRDGLEGLRQAVLQRRDDVVARDKAFAGFERAILNDTDRETLSARRDAIIARTADTMEDVAALDADLDAHTAMLENAIATSAPLLLYAEAAPEFGDRSGWMERIADDREFSLKGALEIATRDLHTKVEHWHGGYALHLDSGRVKSLLRASAHIHQTSESISYDIVHLMLWAHVPEATPALSIRHESVSDKLKKLFSITDDIEVGDQRFDGEFFITGRADAVAALITLPVRTGLLELTRLKLHPSLSIERGLAKLTWHIDTSNSLINVAQLVPRVALDLQDHLRDVISTALDRCERHLGMR